MNRFVALTTLAAACGTCMAQSNSATIYGLIDLGVNHVTGLRGGSNTSLASGIMEGSRWGVRGNEDIGGGYRAVFTLESRLEANNGSFGNRPPSGSQLPDRLSQATALGLPSALQGAVSGVAAQIGGTVGVNLTNNVFDRQAFMGLVTPVGAVLLGRQYTPGYEVAATFDTTGTQSSLSGAQIATLPAAFDIRYSNSIQYRIQQGPVTAALTYALGGVAGDLKANRLVGAMAMYRTDAFSVGVGHNTRNNELGAKSLTSSVIGASAALGPGKVSALYSKISDDNPSGLSGVAAGLIPLLTPVLGAGAPAAAAAVQSAFINALVLDANLMNVGYKFETGPNTIYVAYSRYDDKRPANSDVASYGVVYTYALSKRTDLNFVLTHFDNRDGAQAAPGGNGFIGGVTASAGTDSNNVAFGIRHRF